MTADTKHAVITGGAGEIGFTIGSAFVKAGYSVTLIDRNLPLPAMAAEIEALGAAFREADVTDPDSLNAVVGSLPEIDVAIANAGVHRGARFLNLSLDDWRLMVDVNQTGVLLFCQAAARRMVARGQGGNILITGSWVQDVPQVDNTGYCASKAGAAMIARCMALELAEHDIRVNVLAPGIVDAGMAKRQLRIDPMFASKAANGIPLRRLQTAEQIAGCALFLVSIGAESITGATLLIDGGLSLFKQA